METLGKGNVEVRKASDIEQLISSINSALEEQDQIISSSYNLFESVLVVYNKIDPVCEQEKEGYNSPLANILLDFKNKIVKSNNRLLEFNRKCDL